MHIFISLVKLGLEADKAILLLLWRSVICVV